MNDYGAERRRLEGELWRSEAERRRERSAFEHKERMWELERGQLERRIEEERRRGRSAVEDKERTWKGEREHLKWRIRHEERNSTLWLGFYWLAIVLVWMVTIVLIVASLAD